MNSINQFINNLAINDVGFISFFVLLPLFVFIAFYRGLPLIKGRRKLIILLLVLSILFVQIIPTIIGIRSLILHSQNDQVSYLVIWEVFFGVYVYYSLKPKLIYCWVNDDEKYKAMNTPKNGEGVRKSYPHPLRLVLEASWISVYFVLFSLSIVWGIIGSILTWGFDQKMILMFISGVMFFIHYFLASIEKCPHCNFPIFDIFKKPKLGTNNFFVVACQILFKKSFKCMHCGAHFTVGKSSKSQLPEVK